MSPYNICEHNDVTDAMQCQYAFILRIKISSSRHRTVKSRNTVDYRFHNINRLKT